VLSQLSSKSNFFKTESRLCVQEAFFHTDRAIGYTPETVWLIQASMR